MLLVAGILGLITTAIVFVLTVADNMSSETGKEVAPWWPSWLLAIATLGIFVARHFLAGHVLTW